MNRFVELYTKGACPWCVKAKELLDSLEIPYKEFELGVSATKEDVQKRVYSLNSSAEVRTVPQIFMKTGAVWKYVGGYAELEQLLNTNDSTEV